jgi:hypothetical protein
MVGRGRRFESGRGLSRTRWKRWVVHGYGQDGELERRLGAQLALAATPRDRTHPAAQADGPSGYTLQREFRALGSVTRR